jgi:signal transduction histidine kinase
MLLSIRGVVMYNQTNHEEEHFNKNISQQKLFIDSLIHEKRASILKRYKMKLQNMIDYTPVVSYIKSNNIDALERFMDNRLKALKIEDKAINTLHLIDKDNITIYRAHKPNKKGDDLSSIREVVVKTNQSLRVHHGYEAGLHDVNYRVDVPIVVDGIHYGLIEVGLDLNVVAKKIESVFSNNLVVILLHKDKLSSFMDKDKLDTVGNYYIFYKSKELKKSDISLAEPLINIKDKIYHVSNKNSLPTYDNQELGNLVYFTDVTESVKELEDVKRFLIYQTILIVTAIIALLYFSFTYYENQLNKEIKKSQQKDKVLLQQSKLAIMGEMISMIAHQWRQPLSTINMVVQSLMLKNSLEELKPQELDKELKDIKDISFDLNQTIDDFKQFFKPTKERVETNIKECIEDSLKLINPIVVDNSIKIDIRQDKDISLSIYDKEFKQVVINILNNAKDALIQNNIENKEILIDIKSLDDKVLITFADNAGGIPEDIIDKIFEPYFSTKSKNSSGVGLYMCKMIVDEHLDGLLTAYNQDSGAIFKIELPKPN